MLNAFFYSICNKLNIISIALIYILNIRLKNKEPLNIFKKKIKNNQVKPLICIPKIIWIYWHDENYPLIVQYAIKKIIQLNPDFRVNMLTDKNLGDFISIDINSYHFPKIQHRSDFIRLYLLKEYGGFWLDASILTFSGVDVFLEEMQKNNSDLFAFYNEDSTVDINFPIIENWFLIATKGNQFISDWFVEFEYALKLGVKRYLATVDNKFFQNIEKKNQAYLFNYICAQKALHQYKGNYTFWSCDDTAFYYHITGAWRYFFFKKKIFHYTNIVKTVMIFRKPKTNPLIIKLVAGDRQHVNFLLEKNKYKKDTLIDEFLNK